ncbi:hypothetical protein ACG97_05565 [Vogesella sp. EB]|uniref:YecA family protein n=1 Tax=Vogesella indigofera TaxID=45465 RepID=A0A495BLV1_VOGIN|nr:MULTISPECIES: UPF0149 family protein [Vogesella]KMJ53989.1 hypothetical protein ACG97_05565 [Vogesella sp. EB]RKQ60973.1 uncharacterized protein C8E02_0738 [Vogesella indigofera]
MKFKPMTEQDYQRLGETLSRLAPQGAMSLEKLDGFFAALHAGPEAIKPADCLPTILGAAFDDEAAFASPKVLEKFVAQVMGHWLEIARTLANGEDFYPWLDADEHGVVHGNDWAEGFSEGMQILYDDWTLLFDDAEAAGALAPIMALAFEHHPDPEMRPFLDGASAEQKAEWLGEISTSVAQIYRFFAALRQEMEDAESDANDD